MNELNGFCGHHGTYHCTFCLSSPTEPGELLQGPTLPSPAWPKQFGLEAKRIHWAGEHYVLVSWCDCNCGDAALRKADFTPVWLTGAQAERTAIRLTLSSEKRYFAFHANGLHCLAHVAGT